MTNELESLPLDSIQLSVEQMEQAHQFAQSVGESVGESVGQDRWDVYLHQLARLGVQQWLGDRAPELAIRESAQHLTVGNFVLNIITPGLFIDSTLDLSNPLPKANFHVLVEVIEEQQQVRISGSLNDHQLRQRVVSHDHPLNGITTIALNCFDPDPNRLLLQLRCLESISTSPPINVAAWLRNQLDAAAQSLDWILLPAQTLTPAMRDTQLSAIRMNLAQGGTNIPPESIGAYRQLRWAGGSLALYAFTWSMPQSEWGMVVVVAPDSTPQMPADTRLQIRDETQFLVDATSVNLASVLIHGQVIGQWGEPFWVTVTTDSVSFELAPLTFSPES
jgi:Protein of unknown function (DUF1822)